MIFLLFSLGILTPSCPSNDIKYMFRLLVDANTVSHKTLGNCGWRNFFPLWAVRCDPLKTFTLYTLLMCSLKRKTKRLDLVLLETSSKLLIRRVRTQFGSRLNLGRVHSLDHIDTTFQISNLFQSYWRICIPLTIDPSRSILFMTWFPILLAPTSHLSNVYMSHQVTWTATTFHHRPYTSGDSTGLSHFKLKLFESEPLFLLCACYFTESLSLVFVLIILALL